MESKLVLVVLTVLQPEQVQEITLVLMVVLMALAFIAPDLLGLLNYYTRAGEKRTQAEQRS